MTGRRRAAILFVVPFLVLISAVIAVAATQAIGGASPDRPPFAQEADGDYLRLRDEYIARLRGIETDRFANPLWRESAVQTRFSEEKQRNQAAPNAAPAWTVIGPDSVSNGQALDGGDTTVSGRVTAIAVDPTNSSKVYLGTAQGGVWRSLNGGSTWSPIFDTAQSLSIGALAVAPSNPSVVYVGTGEAHNTNDSFFGVGVYRIDNADTSPTLVGPINPQRTFTCNPAVCAGTFTTTTFSGRSVSRILVDPTNAATIFASTSSGVSGMGANQLGGIPPLGVTGVYRSTNATAAANAVAFQKLAVGIASSFDSPPTGNRQISDMTFVNGNPNTLLVSTFGLNAVNDGGIFRSTNALAATPTFTHTFQVQIQRITYAVNGNTVLAATGESTASGGGRLRESTDGGATWPIALGAADGFCGGQCYYDIAVGIDPQVAGPNFRIYLGGSARGTVAFPQRRDEAVQQWRCVLHARRQRTSRRHARDRIRRLDEPLDCLDRKRRRRLEAQRWRGGRHAVDESEQRSHDAAVRERRRRQVGPRLRDRRDAGQRHRDPADEPRQLVAGRLWRRRVRAHRPEHDEHVQRDDVPHLLQPDGHSHRLRANESDELCRKGRLVRTWLRLRFRRNRVRRDDPLPVERHQRH